MTDIINDDISAALEPTEAEQQLQIPDELPVLPLRDIVIYPFMIVPLFVSREKSIRAVDEALGQHRMILLTCQKDLDKEEPQQDDLYSVGTVAVIMRMLKLPDGRIGQRHRRLFTCTTLRDDGSPRFRAFAGS